MMFRGIRSGVSFQGEQGMHEVYWGHGCRIYNRLGISIFLGPWGFCYTVYNSPKFNGFINCTLCSIIVVRCDNTRKVRAPNAIRHSGVPQVYWPHLKYTFLKVNLFFRVEPRSVEHV
jgi:hypothetical protein